VIEGESVKIFAIPSAE